jgi:hypothetical protein
MAYLSSTNVLKSLSSVSFVPTLSCVIEIIAFVILYQSVTSHSTSARYAPEWIGLVNHIILRRREIWILFLS